MERPATLRLCVAAIEKRSLVDPQKRRASVGMTTETEAEVKTITAAAKTVGAAVCV
jgi:hypothetical protein